MISIHVTEGNVLNAPKILGTPDDFDRLYDYIFEGSEQGAFDYEGFMIGMTSVFRKACGQGQTSIDVEFLYLMGISAMLKKGQWNGNEFIDGYAEAKALTSSMFQVVYGGSDGSEIAQGIRAAYTYMCNNMSEDEFAIALDEAYDTYEALDNHASPVVAFIEMLMSSGKVSIGHETSSHDSDELNMLELAADAADKLDDYRQGTWNPLESKEDAFSLMLALDISLVISEPFEDDHWTILAHWFNKLRWEERASLADKEAVIKQAITQVAGTLGARKADGLPYKCAV